MRFLFVDRIAACGGDAISGTRVFSPGEPLQYDGQIAPGAVSEAIGQLASWLCLERNDFTARPVFLFADGIRVLAPVPAGAAVVLEAKISAMDRDTFAFSGVASVEGTVVQTIDDCNGYFMPLADLEDPAVTRVRHRALTTGGLVLEGAAGAAFDFAGLIDDVKELAVEKTVRTTKTFAASAPFYRDHFPRFPVTPIVMLNEMIGQAATRLLTKNKGDVVRVKRIKDIKIKSFVRPEELCETRVKVQTITIAPGARLVSTIAEVLKDDKRILRGQYEFEITEKP